MKENAQLQGTSTRSQNVLLALIYKGLSREKAYDLIQRHALEEGDFANSLLEDKEVLKHLTEKELHSCLYRDEFSTEIIEKVFERVFE